MMANTFDWIEIRTNHIEETAQFFESLFGWQITRKLDADGSPVWLFDTGGEPRLENLRRGGLWLRPADERPGVVVYILVEDINETLQKAVELGGNIVAHKSSQGSAFKAFFTDPSGTLFGLWEEKN
jgi:predicted enzyme related to lactoylglutathione lyase